MSKPLTTNKLRTLLLEASAGTPFSLLDDTLKWILLDTAYVPDVAHDFVDDVAANEVSGTGYASGFAGSGRKTVASKDVIFDGTGVPAFDAADPTWTGADFGQPGWLGFWKPGTSDADSPFLGVIKLTTEPTDGTDFSVHIPAAGLFPLKDVTP